MNAFDPTPVLSQSDADSRLEARAKTLFVPTQPLTEGALCDWIANATAGDQLQYHYGLLLVDRSEGNSRYPTRERQRIHAVARRAWHACELGLVHLVSQRIEPFVFRYIVVRARMTPLASQARKQLISPAH